MLDLYSVYKQYYQRWHRNQEDFDLLEMKNISRDMVKHFYNIRFDSEKLEEFRFVAIEIAKDLIERERSINAYTIFGNKLLRSLKNNEFQVTVPYSVQRLWNSSNLYGEVYVLTSDQMEGCSKLGATTMDIKLRVRKYENRYGYKVKLFYSIEIISPFYFEKFIAKLIKDHKVFSQSSEHTNEWYFLPPEFIKNIINNNISNFLKTI